MTGPKMIDISADLSEELRRIDQEPRGRDSLEDRVLAATLREDGYDDAMLVERFGYLPKLIEKGSWRSLLPSRDRRVDAPRRDRQAAVPEPSVERVVYKAGVATKRQAEMG